MGVHQVSKGAAERHKDKWIGLLQKPIELPITPVLQDNMLRQVTK